MAFPLLKYAAIKDNYCLCYYGWNEIYVRQMLLARHAIEERFPGICVHLSFQDSLCYLCASDPRIVPKSMLEKAREEMAHIKVLGDDSRGNPVRRLLEDSGIAVSQEI